jgi:heterotetrameric sarcosine oxidase gamma subunit
VAELVHRTALARLAGAGVHRTPALEILVAQPRAIVRWQIADRVVQPARVGDVELPAQPNSSSGDDPCVLWLAPREWLLVSATLPADELTGLAAAASQGHLHQVTDVSDSYQVLGLAGNGVRTLLARGCGIDLHPRAFPPGRCARTRFAQIAVLIHHFAPGRFHLYVDRSYARWLWDWLVDAAGTGQSAPGEFTGLRD